ncbi:hypothetical protein BD560DRAFT_492795 [Blakeslea trispora]|nr:hypothetical protein BD560DRAFT_492795 [Blakeslea trispora]
MSKDIYCIGYSLIEEFAVRKSTYRMLEQEEVFLPLKLNEEDSEVFSQFAKNNKFVENIASPEKNSLELVKMLAFLQVMIIFQKQTKPRFSSIKLMGDFAIRVMNAISLWLRPNPQPVQLLKAHVLDIHMCGFDIVVYFMCCQDIKTKQDEDQDRYLMLEIERFTLPRYKMDFSMLSRVYSSCMKIKANRNNR